MNQNDRNADNDVSQVRTDEPTSPLIHRIFHETGDRLTPSHTNRHGRRIRYYISRRLISEGPDPTAWRLPAPQLEDLILAVLREHLRGCAQRHDMLTYPEATSSTRLAADLRHLAEAQSAVLWPLISNVHLKPGAIQIKLSAPDLAKALYWQPDDLNPASMTIEHPFQLRRRGVETRIVSGTPEPSPDPILQLNLGRAHAWAQALRQGQSIAAIALAQGCSESHIRSRLTLVFLSPTVQRAILTGNVPPQWTTYHLLNQKLPSDWTAQERLLGL